MKRTLVTALLLSFFLLTVGSLGCKAAALPLSAPVAAAMAEEGLSSTQQSACYSQQAGALEQLTRQKTRQLWEEHLSDALPQTARQQLEDWYWQEPFEQNRWDWGELWQQLNRSIQDKLRTLLHELLDEPLRLLGTLIGMVVLCAVLGALRQNGTTSGMRDSTIRLPRKHSFPARMGPLRGWTSRSAWSLLPRRWCCWESRSLAAWSARCSRCGNVRSL